MKKTNVKKWVWIVIVVLLFIGVDQAAKIYTVTNLQENTIKVIENVFQLSYFKNTGAALGMLQDNLFLILIADVIVIAFVLRFLIVQFERMSMGTKIGISCILAGRN